MAQNVLSIPSTFPGPSGPRAAPVEWACAHRLSHWPAMWLCYLRLKVENNSIFMWLQNLLEERTAGTPNQDNMSLAMWLRSIGCLNFSCHSGLKDLQSVVAPFISSGAWRYAVVLLASASVLGTFFFIRLVQRCVLHLWHFGVVLSAFKPKHWAVAGVSSFWFLHPYTPDMSIHSMS